MIEILIGGAIMAIWGAASSSSQEEESEDIGQMHSPCEQSRSQQFQPDYSYSYSSQSQSSVSTTGMTAKQIRKAEKKARKAAERAKSEVDPNWRQNEQLAAQYAHHRQVDGIQIHGSSRHAVEVGEDAIRDMRRNARHRQDSDERLRHVFVEDQLSYPWDANGLKQGDSVQGHQTSSSSFHLRSHGWNSRKNVAAHELGHIVHGDDEQTADDYARG